jgi:chromosome segregation ATPase
MPARDIDSVVARYAGEPRAATRTAIADAPGLKGKLSELAGQLAAVQNENEAIRGRYLELEDAFQGMIDENKRVHSTNEELRSMLEASEAAGAQKDRKISKLEGDIRMLRNELEKQAEAADSAVAELKAEQLDVGRKNVECDKLRREMMSLSSHGMELREDWDDKVFKLSKAEEARDHYKAELHKLAAQYGDLVEKLSFVVMDYTVRTSATMVQGKDGMEPLSTYLNRVYDEQEMTNAKFARIGAINVARQPLQ